MSYTKAQLQQALVRAVEHHGHYYTCGARHGLDSECHCGWVEIRKLAKQIKETQS